MKDVVPRLLRLERVANLSDQSLQITYKPPTLLLFILWYLCMLIPCYRNIIKSPIGIYMWTQLHYKLKIYRVGK